MTDQFQRRPWTPTTPYGEPAAGPSAMPPTAPPPPPPPRRISPWVWVGVVVAVLVLLGGVVTAGLLAGRAGARPAPSPQPGPVVVSSSSAPTTFPTTSATAAVPSAAGYTVQSMFGSGNGPCRTVDTLAGEVAAIGCDTSAQFTTFFSQYSGTWTQFVATDRSSYATYALLREDACAADYRASSTSKEGVTYQYYVRVYKKMPFAWAQSSRPDQVTWEQAVASPPIMVADPTALCGGV